MLTAKTDTIAKNWKTKGRRNLELRYYPFNGIINHAMDKRVDTTNGQGAAAVVTADMFRCDRATEKPLVWTNPRQTKASLKDAFLSSPPQSMVTIAVAIFQKGVSNWNRLFLPSHRA